ncbi:hypothetical protein PROPEN_03386 [Proteus penneri ATCC 35198]|nr:hypothetical protein PROPEN_03386 [Proteus penneri ATCC 35198]
MRRLTDLVGLIYQLMQIFYCINIILPIGELYAERLHSLINRNGYE